MMQHLFSPSFADERRKPLRGVRPRSAERSDPPPPCALSAGATAGLAIPHVTVHAIERYIERIDPDISWTGAIAAIHAADGALQIAIAFGARVVRLGNGAKLILEGSNVVTVVQRHVIHHRPGSGDRPDAIPLPIPSAPAVPAASAIPRKPETGDV